jgi:predicted Ser/Thr protein kinase
VADLEATATETAAAEAETEAGSSSDPSRYLSSPAAPGVGSTIGRYRVESVLGRGGEGIVLAAYDPRLDRHVALKVLRAEHRDQQVRLVNEGQAIARLRHPNVITVYDVGEHGDDLFIAMELIRGASLRTWLAERRAWRDALAVVGAAGRGLAAAHAAGLVHGDVKPENILVADDGHVVIGDFGLARPSTLQNAAAAAAAPEEMASTGFTGGITGGLAGTPAYLAPELWRGRPSTAASDQFALAVTLYEAIYGMRPFEGGRSLALFELAEVVQAGRRAPSPPVRVPRRIVRALDRALALDPQARFPSVTAFLDELTPWHPSGDGRHGRSETRAKRRWLAPAAVLLVAAGAATALVVTRGPDRDEARAAACTAAASRIDTVWNDAARASYGQRHAGASWLEEQTGWLDGFARDWSSTRLAVCKGSATLARTAPDAAVACLDRALDSLTTAAADTGDTWPELPALRDCLAPPVVRPQSRSFVFGPQGFPVLSPDAREIAMSTYSGDAYIAALDAPIAPRPIPGAYEVLAWFDDGTRYIASRDHRYELVAPDGTVTPIGRLDAFVPRASQLSPDRAYVSFETGNHVEIRTVATGEVVGAVDGSPAYTSWEPDGHRIAVSLPDRIVMFDPATRRTTQLELRVPLGPEGIRDAIWMRPGELLIAGQVHGERRGGLWSVSLDDAGHLRGAPRLRMVPEPATSLMPNDHRGDRLTVKQFSAKQRTFAWRGGQARELRSTLDYADVIAFDAATGRAMSLRNRELLVYTIDSAPAPTTINVEPGTYAFRGGAISSLRADGPGRWSLVDLALDGTTRVVAHLAWDAGTPTLACDNASAGHCAIVGERGGLMIAAALDGSTIGREVALPGMRGDLAVSPDGKRWLSVHDTDGIVVEIDAATGRIVAEHPAAPPDCYTFGAGWRAGKGGIWARYACADRFALVRGPVDDGRYEPILESDGWMSGVVGFGDDQYLYSVQDNDGALLVIDGM